MQKPATLRAPPDLSGNLQISVDFLFYFVGLCEMFCFFFTKKGSQRRLQEEQQRKQELERKQQEEAKQKVTF